MNQRVIYTREERKAQALDAGLKLAQESGVKGVSVSAIARECGVTAPLLFHIFGDRDSVHRAIQAHARKKKVKLPTATAAPRKRSVAEVKAIKNKTATKKAATKRATKRAARKPVPLPVDTATKRATTKKPKAPASAPAAGSTRKAAGGRSAAAKTAGSKRKTGTSGSTGSRKRFKVQPPPTTADVATPGDAPAA